MKGFMAGFWFVFTLILCFAGLLTGVAGIINAVHAVWQTATILLFISEGLVILGGIGLATLFSLDG